MSPPLYFSGELYINKSESIKIHRRKYCKVFLVVENANFNFRLRKVIRKSFAFRYVALKSCTDLFKVFYFLKP